MIPRLHERARAPHDPLAEALGRPVSPDDGPIEHFVVAHWPGLDHYTVDRGQKTWSCAQWAEHLDDAYWSTPSPPGRAVLGGRSGTCMSGSIPTTVTWPGANGPRSPTGSHAPPAWRSRAWTEAAGGWLSRPGPVDWT
ncbi:hypothetical protein [Streptomyces sp. CAS3]